MDTNRACYIYTSCLPGHVPAKLQRSFRSCCKERKIYLLLLNYELLIGLFTSVDKNTPYVPHSQSVKLPSKSFPNEQDDVTMGAQLYIIKHGAVIINASNVEK